MTHSVKHTATLYSSPSANTLTDSIESDCAAIRFFNNSSTETLRVYVGDTKNYIEVQPLSNTIPFVTEVGGTITTVFFISFNGATGVCTVLREFRYEG